MGPNFVWEVSKAFAEKVSFKLSLKGQVELSLMKRRELVGVGVGGGILQRGNRMWTRVSQGLSWGQQNTDIAPSPAFSPQPCAGLVLLPCQGSVLAKEGSGHTRG